MEKKFKKKFCATAIGSVPHLDAAKICKRILKDYADIPFWPQMPKRTFFENMYVQFIEGFPCAVIDEKKRRVWIDTSRDLLAELEGVYQRILDGDDDYFTMSDKCALGLHEFISRSKAADLTGVSYLKGHVTGPISFGLSVTDQKKQSILYHNELSELIPKILAVKARLEIRKLKGVFNDVIIFIDEPYLVSVGSSVVNIKKDDVTAKIGEVVAAVHGEGALTGIHCCGNTDWSLLLGLDLDILSFDAYNFSKSLSLYPDMLKEFVADGRMLAWGIVPTSGEAKTETVEGLFGKLRAGFKFLADKGIEEKMILDSLLLTPSCGCGTMEMGEAERVLALNVELSERLRQVYGG